MVGFNWIDIIILILLASAVYGGIKIGFLTLLLTFGGFFVSLFLVGSILPHLLPIHNPTLLAVINGNLLLIISIYVALKGHDLGEKLHRSFKKSKAHIVESIAGLSLSLSSAVIIIWLIAAAIVSLPFVSFANTVESSYFVQLFSRHLPAAPAVFEQFSSLVNPDQTPEVYVKDQSNSSIGSAPIPSVSSAVKNDSTSVVRITGFGCSGIVSGSGFVVTNDIIATNAHVIAGVKRPIIKYGSRSYVGNPILFDPNLDFALLKVNGLKAKPLPLDTASLNKGSDVYTIGFPASIFTINGGLISGSLQFAGPNIYGLGTIIRDIYVIRSPISRGLSGGPLVLSNGQVVGIIFARSSTNNSYGYALTADSLASDLSKGVDNKTTVGTGACVE